MKGKLVFAGLLILFTASSASANLNLTDLSRTPADNTIWADETLEFEYTCETTGELDSAYLKMEEPVKHELITPLKGNATEVLLDYNPPELGEYYGKVFCRATANGSKIVSSRNVSFEYARLQFEDITVQGKPVYTDAETLEIRFRLLKNDTETVGELDSVDSAQIDIPGWNRSVFYYDTDDSSFVLKGEPGFQDPMAQAELQVVVNGTTHAGNVDLDVRKPLEADFSRITDKPVPGEKIEFSINPDYRGESVPVENLSIKVEVDGSTVNKEQDSRGISFELPGTGSSPKVDIEVSYTENGDTFTDSFSTELALYNRFKGLLKNNDGQGLTGRIIFTGQKRYVDVIEKGKYDLRVPSGTYNLTLTGVKGVEKVVLREVEIDSSMEDALRLDNPGEFNIGGLESYGALGLETVLEFDTATILLKYDSKRAGSEKGLSAYRCSDYNFDSRECFGQFLKIDSSADQVRNYLAFDTRTLGGFTVSRTQQLSLRSNLNELENTTRHLEEVFELKGTVTADGKRAPGVDVNATVNGDTYTTETGKRGGFKLNVELPGKPGEYELGVNAGQKPYRGVSDSVRFHVEADRGIRLETSRDAEMNATKGVKTVKLVNTGQVALEDLDVDAELSCRKCSLDYAPMKIERLEPGSSTLIDLRFDVPESREMIRGTISVAGRETKASRNFAVIIETPEQENVTSEPEESATPVFTGFSFQMPSVQIGKNYLVVLNVLTLIAISAVFFYFRRDSGESDLERLENLRDLAVE